MSMAGVASCFTLMYCLGDRDAMGCCGRVDGISVRAVGSGVVSDGTGLAVY